ncbi:MAG TPA: PhnD/SsuA/transferrin family substrate-binding protein, partial [Aggregatilineales bacterium]|nr:PhnD/SsuA/transferrin family substrate-binding protein [Aggregatilineales bacterium]
KVVVIDVSAPIPNDTLSYSPMLSEDARTAITEALVAIAADEANLELLGAVYDWSGLEPAEDAFFDDFREQLDAAGVDVEDLQ